MAMWYGFGDTALGLMAMAATDKGVCFVDFAGNEATLVDRLMAQFPDNAICSSRGQARDALDCWIEALNLHISGGAVSPDLPLDMRGSAFQIMVWQFLLTVAEGCVMSYGAVAEAMGKPRAARAVAAACAKNAIAVLVPCHRVIRGDGGLGGYRWGIERKQWLLAKECYGCHRHDNSLV